MRMDLSKLVVASAVVFLSPAAYGFVSPSTSAQFSKANNVKIGTQVVRPNTERANSKSSFASLNNLANAQVELDSLTGAVRLISGGELAPQVSLKGSRQVEDFVFAAKNFVTEHQDIFGISADDLVLNEAATLLDDDVQFLKFRVLRTGHVITDAQVDFRFKQGKLLQVVNLSFAEATVANKSLLAKSQLESRIVSQLQADTISLQGEALRVVQDKDGYHLVAVAEFNTKSANERFIVQIDSSTGVIFEVKPTVYYLQGSASGSVYPRWYTETPEIRPYYDLNLVYAGGSVTTDMDGNFIEVPDTAEPQISTFTGLRVRAVASTGTAPTVSGAQIRDNWVIRYERSATESVESDKNMAHSMVYAHTNDMIRYAKRYINSPWLDARLTANVNLASTCNAHWDGSTINLYSAGNGCANTGLISDVVYHEWGHGLDHNTGGIDDGAYSEGFGDVMSLIMTHSNVLGIGFRFPSLEPVRDLEPNKVYPRDAGEVHDEGMIIGGTFWDLFKYLKEEKGETVAGDIVSNIALKTIYTASRYTEVYNAALVVDDDNGDLNDNTPNYCIINKAFAEHGLAEADQACELATISTFEVDDSAGNGNGIMEPGETVQLWAQAQNSAPGSLNGLHGVLSIGDVVGVNVTQSDLNWDAIPARSSQQSNNAATLEIATDATCGTTFTATVNLAADTRTATTTADFALGLLTGTEQTFTAVGLPAPITDKNSTIVDLSVDGSEWGNTTTAQAARLKVAITHTYIGDLTIFLVSPAGVEKEIYKGSGSDDNLDLDLDVSAAISGLPGLGIWKLKVTDKAVHDEGTLDVVEFKLTPAVYVCN